MDVATVGKINKPARNIWKLLAIVTHIFITIQK